MQVSQSSFPVLTSVTIEVRMSRDSEVRKKRSAGSAGALGVVTEAAMVEFPS
jgi:hypothetical protein